MNMAVTVEAAAKDVDMEEVFEMFLDKSHIRDNEQIIFKKLEQIETGSVDIEVVTKPRKNVFRVTTGYYLASAGQIVEINNVVMNSSFMKDIMAFSVEE